MSCLKAVDQRIAARDPDRETAEIRIRNALMNNFPALGRAGIEVAAQTQSGQGQLAPE